MSNPEEEAEMDATPENIRAWAKKDPNTEWVHQDWDMEVAQAKHADLILSLVEEDCPQSDFFVSCLYLLVGSYFTTNGKTISRNQIDELLSQGEQRTNQNVQHWVNRSRAFLLNPEKFGRDSWAEGGWALDENIWRLPDEERVAIIEEITAAFHGVPRGEITLHEADVWDNYGSEEEAEQARSLDIDNCWEDIPEEWIEECSSALPFLDPQSWRYYIPAYMIWTLKNYENSDSIVSEWTVYTFCMLNRSKNEPDSKENDLERFQQLNQKQSAAVYLFLKYMGEHYLDDAEEAIQQYWKKFSPAEQD